MNVRFTPRAPSEAERMKTWWQKNRPIAPNVFDDEMALAVVRMRTSPTVGVAYPSRFGRLVRKVLMPKTNNHIYYAVREDEIIVLSGGPTADEGPNEGGAPTCGGGPPEPPDDPNDPDDPECGECQGPLPPVEWRRTRIILMRNALARMCTSTSPSGIRTP